MAPSVYVLAWVPFGDQAPPRLIAGTRSEKVFKIDVARGDIRNLVADPPAAHVQITSTGALAGASGKGLYVRPSGPTGARCARK